MNVTIGFSISPVIVSIVVSHCKKKVILMGASDVIWSTYRCFMSLENSKPKGLRPRGCSGACNEICSYGEPA